MCNIYPPDRVLISDNIPMEFCISEKTQYKDILTKKQKDLIISKYKRKNLFNQESVRLDLLQNQKAVFSLCDFYSFLCCHIAGMQDKDEIAYPVLKKKLVKYGDLNSFDKVLSIEELPNQVAVSILLKDCTDHYLLIKRNVSSTISSATFACSVTGTMEKQDLEYKNPIIRCAERELKEELNITTPLSIQKAVISKQKMQPVILLSGQVARPWPGLLPYISSSENNNFILAHKNQLLPLIKKYDFTDIAAYQIFLELEISKSQWDTLNNDINIYEYIV